MPTKYEKFAAAILERDAAGQRAIKLKYQGEDQFRKVWPHALGKDSTGADVALCHQYAGPHTDPDEPHESFRHLRCFKLAKMVNEDVTRIVFNAGDEGFDPPYLGFKHLRKQTCIDDVEVHRPKP